MTEKKRTKSTGKTTNAYFRGISRERKSRVLEILKTGHKKRSELASILKLSRMATHNAVSYLEEEGSVLSIYFAHSRSSKGSRGRRSTSSLINGLTKESIVYLPSQEDDVVKEILSSIPNLDFNTKKCITHLLKEKVSDTMLSKIKLAYQYKKIKRFFDVVDYWSDFSVHQVVMQNFSEKPCTYGNFFRETFSKLMQLNYARKIKKGHYMVTPKGKKFLLGLYNIEDVLDQVR